MIWAFLAFLAAWTAWRARDLPALFADFLTPGDDGGPGYRRGVIGMAHACLGAGVFALTPGGVAWQLAVVAIYIVAKELGDIRKGGDPLDSAEDAAFVAVGTFYAGPATWPLAVLLCGGAAMLTGWRR